MESEAPVIGPVMNTITKQMKGFREDLKSLKSRVWDYKNDVKEGNVIPKADGYGEVMANLTLAYRHLEDARMRFGLVIQAIEGPLDE